MTLACQYANDDSFASQLIIKLKWAKRREEMASNKILNLCAFSMTH